MSPVKQLGKDHFESSLHDTHKVFLSCFMALLPVLFMNTHFDEKRFPDIKERPGQKASEGYSAVCNWVCSAIF